jgi:predicted dehydrogenase
MYTEAKVFPDFRLLLDEARPDAVFIGLPPNAHGSAKPPRNIEMVCAAVGVPMLLEKPLGCEPPEHMQSVVEALARAAAGGLIISVGYMFRYARAVAKMQEIIAQTSGGV